MNRRALLALTPGAAVAGITSMAPTVAGMAATSTPSPDAELLAVCAEFDALERRFLATDFEVADNDTPEGQAVAAEQRSYVDAQDPLVDRMCELRTTTMEGHRARARSLALWDAELFKTADGDAGEGLTAAIVRDLIG